MTAPEPASPKPRKPIQYWVKLILQGIIVIGIGASLYETQWLNAATISGILLLTMLPTLIGRRLDIRIPVELEVFTIAFVFAALFLGEARNYYERLWWWDIALHTTSGGLLGILGVLLVYVLNESPRIDINMRPGFVAFFAFCFSVAVGAIWEIFEFSMDQLAGANMQKPMFGDDSGLTDTMWDLIVDTIGALVICVAGYVYMKRGVKSLVGRWIDRFVELNPRLFRQG